MSKPKKKKAHSNNEIMHVQLLLCQAGAGHDGRIFVD